MSLRTIVILIGFAMIALIGGLITSPFLSVALLLFGSLAGAALIWVVIRDRVLFPYLLVAVIGLDSFTLFSDSGLAQSLAKPAMLVIIALYFVINFAGRRSRFVFAHSNLLGPAAVFVAYTMHIEL